MERWERWKRGRLDLPLALGLATAVVLAYSGILRNGFVNFDDPLYVTANPVTQKGLSASGVAWAFTTGFASNWHPLTWLSVMLDVEHFGLNPPGPHSEASGAAPHCRSRFAAARAAGQSRARRSREAG